MVNEAEKDALAALLIELAFLVPRGTNILLHPIFNKLVTYVREVRKSVEADYEAHT